MMQVEINVEKDLN